MLSSVIEQSAVKVDSTEVADLINEKTGIVLETIRDKTIDFDNTAIIDAIHKIDFTQAIALSAFEKTVFNVIEQNYVKVDFTEVINVIGQKIEAMEGEKVEVDFVPVLDAIKHKVLDHAPIIDAIQNIDNTPGITLTVVENAVRSVLEQNTVKVDFTEVTGVITEQTGAVLQAIEHIPANVDLAQEMRVIEQCMVNVLLAHQSSAWSPGDFTEVDAEIRKRNVVHYNADFDKILHAIEEKTCMVLDAIKGKTIHFDNTAIIDAIHKIDFAQVISLSAIEKTVLNVIEQNTFKVDFSEVTNVIGERSCIILQAMKKVDVDFTPILDAIKHKVLDHSPIIDAIHKIEPALGITCIDVENAVRRKALPKEK